MKKEAIFDKVLGSLVGFAIGDAMGATTEFMTAEAIHEKYGQVSTIMGGGWLNLEPGEVTDDTQMMILVADSYNTWMDSERSGHPVPFKEQCCRKFSEWYMSNPKDMGNACRTVIASCFGKSAEDWIELAEEVNHKYPSRGNGSLMRCLYPAIIGDVEAAVLQGTLTHNNTEVSNYIKSYVHAIQINLSKTITRSKAHLDKQAPEGTAEATFINSVYWSNCPSFKEAILGAVNDGGDADTISALTGGLAGARFGFHKIPTEWVQKLDEHTYYKLRTLTERATTIIDGGTI